MRNIFTSIGGVLLALIAFFVTWPSLNLVYRLISTARDEPTWWQFILSELVTPAIGAYIAMLLITKLPKPFDWRVVFWGFAASLLTLSSINIINSYQFYLPQDRIDDFRSVAISTALNFLAAVVSAYSAYRTSVDEEERLLG